ncbi:MAG TPA: HAD family hydrolase [Pirellulales bacterium]|nr:HAD family hydrolase [Pirellulales bacterium]
MALSRAGIEIDPVAVKAVMGLPKLEAIRLLLSGAGGSFTDAEPNAIHVDFVRRMRNHYSFDPSVREVPGASAAFATLRRAGIKVALNTGFSRTISAAVLSRLGWHAPAAIDADVASDEVPYGRPRPDMIRALMARLGVDDPRRVAKVGDTRADMEEGANARCGLVIGVTTGTFSREHAHIVDSVAEAPALLLPPCR